MTPPDAHVQPPLFGPASDRLQLGPGAWLLQGFALQRADELIEAIGGVIRLAPLRHMITARGWRMSVATTNCGAVGWLSDGRGYRYDAMDPVSLKPWPAMPRVVAELAARAADAAGFEAFDPDACLINRYAPGARLSLHQDRDERDYAAPIVSISLGLPATFLWGGASRSDRPHRVRLVDGDVVVWGGTSRLNFHGIDTLQEGHHARTGAARFNLTLRRAR